MRRTVLLCTALLLAGCSGGQPGDVPGGSDPSGSPSPFPTVTMAPAGSWPADAVPWLPNQARFPEIGIESPRPPARPCTAADLPATADFVDRNGAGGTLLHVIEVRNAGPSRCSLGGYPVLLSAGETVPIKIDPDTLTDKQHTREERPATLDPDERATFVLGSSMSCGGGADRTYRDIRVRLLDRELPIPNLTLTTTCPIRATGVFRRLSENTPEKHYAGLTVHIDAPAWAAIGTDVDYVVTLTNPGREPITLDPCPVYMETLYKGGGIYRLNCAPDSIPAGGSLRFAMRLTVPAYTPAKDWKLEWTLYEPGSQGPTGTATVRVG